MAHAEFEASVAGVAALNDPTRHALYRVVSQAPDAVSRDEAATAVGVPRSVAAFHLDRLAETGLLEVEFRRLTGRQGPGAGRPAKLYRRADRDVSVSLPERRYDLAGKVLARAVSEAIGNNVPVAETLPQAAADLGRLLGESVTVRPRGRGRGGRSPLAVVSEVLVACGFEPRSDGPDLILGNCPFRALAEEHPDLVCGMNVHLVEGLLAGLEATGVTAVLDPEPGRCCVRLRAA